MTKLVFILTQSIVDQSHPRVDPVTGVRYVDVDVATADVNVAGEVPAGIIDNLDEIRHVPYPLRVQRMILDEVILGGNELQELMNTFRPRALSIQNCPNLTLGCIPRSIQRLDLSGNHELFHGCGISTIVNCLRQLRHLCLEHCELSKENCVALAGAISQASNLKHLNVAGNDIGNVGIEVLSFNLKLSGSIEELIIAECNISESGGMFLASQLPELENLRMLDLELNPLKTEGVQAIVQSLVRCQCLQRINLAQCGCNDVHHLLISSTNQTLLEVDIDNAPDAQEVISAITSRNLASTVSQTRCLFLGSDIVRKFTSNPTFDRSLLHEIFSMCPPIRPFPKRRHSS